MLILPWNQAGNSVTGLIAEVKMNAEELEKIFARHEMQCLELKESFNVECIETACAFFLY